MSIRSYIILFLIIQTGISYSQSIERYNFYASGSYADVGGFELQSSIGELMPVTFIGSTQVLTQGFVQSNYSILSDLANSGSPMSIILYPNPVSGTLNLKMDNGDHDCKFQILDIYGNMQNVMMIKNDDNNWAFDLTSFARGVYFISVSEGPKKAVYRFIKV